MGLAAVSSRGRAWCASRRWPQAYHCDLDGVTRRCRRCLSTEPAPPPLGAQFHTPTGSRSSSWTGNRQTCGGIGHHRRHNLGLLLHIPATKSTSSPMIQSLPPDIAATELHHFSLIPLICSSPVPIFNAHSDYMMWYCDRAIMISSVNTVIVWSRDVWDLELRCMLLMLVCDLHCRCVSRTLLVCCWCWNVGHLDLEHISSFVCALCCLLRAILFMKMQSLITLSYFCTYISWLTTIYIALCYYYYFIAKKPDSEPLNRRPDKWKREPTASPVRSPVRFLNYGREPAIAW